MQAFLMALALLAQQKPEMSVTSEEDGVFVQKPKDEKWSIKKGDEGVKMYKGAAAVVNHRIDDLQIEVLVSKRTEEQKFGEFDEIVSGMIKNFEEEEGKKIPDRKVKKIKSDKAKFPGAGGPQGWFAHIEVYDKDQLVRSIRHWMFIDKKNPTHMLRISIVGPDDLYKKYEKDVNFVLGSIQTFQVKKKK